MKGFSFSPETQAEGIHGKAARHAAAQVLARELAMRARRVAAAKADAFKLSRAGAVLWRDEEIARLEPADDPLKPSVVLIADEHLAAPDREKVQARLEAWLGEIVADRLKALVEVAKAEDVTGLARGIAFRLTENFGILKRDLVGEEMKHLDQTARAQLRKYGVRFGAFNIYFPALLKPAAAELALTLWALKHAGDHKLTLDALPEPPRAGLTSMGADASVPEAFYRACGYHVCGPRAVRLDILERLADLIRPLLAWRPAPDGGSQAPKGSTGDGGFMVTPEMMSILGCSPDELGHVLKALGFKLERRPAPSAPQAEASEPPPASDVPPAGEEGLPAQAVVAAATVPGETPAAEPAAPQPEVTVQPPVAAEPAVIEIWRARRHHRHAEHRGRRRDGTPGRESQPATAPAPASAAPSEPVPHERAARPRPGPEGRKEHHRRDHHHRDRQRDGKRHDRRRADERGAPQVLSAGPARAGAVDPDSPFALLGALRDALEKQAREKSSS